MSNKKTKGNGEGSIYLTTKNGKDVWCADVLVGYNEKGLPKRKRFFGKLKKDVKFKMDNILEELRLNKYCDTDTMRAKTWVNVWLGEYKKGSVSTSTYASYKYLSDKHIIPEIGEMKIKEIKPFHLQKLLNEKVSTGLSYDTIRLIRITLRSCFKEARYNKIITEDPTENLKIPSAVRKSSRQAKAFTIDEVNVFLKEVGDSRLYNLMYFLFNTGLRIGEALALDIGDIDLKAKTISVNKSFKVNSKDKEISATKTATSVRTIPIITDGLLEIIKKQLLQNKEEQLLAGQIYKGNNLLFPSGIGTILLYSTVKRTFNNACCNKEFTIHSTRHTFATRCLEAGVNIKTVSKWLGHANIKITLDTYSHVLEKFEGTEIDKISKHLACSIKS